MAMTTARKGAGYPRNEGAALGDSAAADALRHVALRGRKQPERDTSSYGSPFYYDDKEPPTLHLTDAHHPAVADMQDGEEYPVTGMLRVHRKETGQEGGKTRHSISGHFTRLDIGATKAGS